MGVCDLLSIFSCVIVVSVNISLVWWRCSHLSVIASFGLTLLLYEPPLPLYPSLSLVRLVSGEATSELTFRLLVNSLFELVIGQLTYCHMVLRNHIGITPALISDCLL